MSELPSSWELCRFGDIARIRNGYAFKSSWFKEKREVSTDVPLIRQSQLKGAVADLSEAVFLDTSLLEEFYDYRIQYGDVLIGMSGSIGKVCVYQDEQLALQNQRTGKIEVHPGADLEPKFLGLYLSSIERTLVQFAKGMGVQNISSKDIEGLPFSLPPLAEQRRIVAKVEELFSELDEGVANLKKARAQLAVYRQALLKHAFEGHLTADWRTQHAPELESADQLLGKLLQERRTKWKGRGRYSEPEQPRTDEQVTLPDKWVWASPEQLSSFDNYSLAIGPFGSNLKVSDYKEAGVPLVFVRNIRASQFGSGRTIYVTPSKAEELRAHGVSGGDILITKMGEPPGDAAIYPESQPDAVITADCIKLRLSPLLTHRRYFLHAINAGIVRQQVINISSGVAQQKVSLGRFSSIAIPLPPQAEQGRIVNELDAQLSAIDVVEADIDLNLQKAEALRQSILKKAFAGELVPQDPADEPAAALLSRIRAEREAAATAKPGKPRKAKKP